MGTIQYPASPTHNGATPTGNTQVYSSPVTVSNGMKRYFRAIAYKAGMNDSEESWYEVDNTGGNMAQLSDEATVGGQPEYDPNGNLTQYKGWTYTYDAQNRLRLAHNNGVLVATYYYDSKNRQIARNLNGAIRFNVWDGWELLEEWADGATRSTTYLQGATGIIKSWGNNGTFYYYQDKLGSTTHIANASGALLESYRYDLWGTPSYFNSTSQPINSSTYGIVDLYAGERWVGELGLYDLRNRFMSSELGRFLQADPIGFKGDGTNLYRYCGNDSVNKSDPMGLENPPARIMPDRFWEMARYSDSSNTAQKNFAEWMQRFQPAGMIMATVDKGEAEKKGLKVRYHRYPEKGPGGRPVVDRALKVLGSKPHGRFLLGGRGVLTIQPTDKHNPLGIKGVKGDLRLYLDPSHSLFYDPETYRKIYRDNPGEKPPDSDEGRASVIGHELGHRFEEFDEDMGGRNVRVHENAVRGEHGIEPRRSYGGHQFPVEQ
jgi:RHS repeat-associated protein